MLYTSVYNAMGYPEKIIPKNKWKFNSRGSFIKKYFLDILEI